MNTRQPLLSQIALLAILAAIAMCSHLAATQPNRRSYLSQKVLIKKFSIVPKPKNEFERLLSAYKLQNSFWGLSQQHFPKVYQEITIESPNAVKLFVVTKLHRRGLATQNPTHALKLLEKAFHILIKELPNKNKHKARLRLDIEKTLKKIHPQEKKQAKHTRDTQETSPGFWTKILKKLTLHNTKTSQPEPHEQHWLLVHNAGAPYKMSNASP